jgi:cytochrome c553
MRKLFGILTLVLAPAVGYAADPAIDPALDWAFAQKGNDTTVKPANALPDKRVNQALVDASYTGLPRMPEAVAKGNPLPCTQCHLANGNSRPETGDISGLSVNYIIEQVHAYRDGDRADRRTGRMVAVAKGISEKDLKDAAEYYAAIGPDRQKWETAVVAAEAPDGYGPPGFARLHVSGGATVPIPQGRIFQMPVDDDENRVRDQNLAGYLVYVRADDMALGEQLATTGGNGETQACAACHGADLKGAGDVPRLAGRQPYYLIRTLKDMQTGERKDKNVALMKPVVAKLSDRDIVALAAYLSSKNP